MKTVKQLVAEAAPSVPTWSQAEALERLEDPGVQFVDIRDIRELWREGSIPGAFHAPRGMLEFWVDPQSPYAKDIFQQDKTFVLFCGSGWRSALAGKALIDMGFDRIAHIEGGFSEWVKLGQPVEPKPKS
ncbi:MAG: rhodanese-like domain-containing protein [Gammaproteobacteria bacterium]|nr:rhodanese-like domain-containing protein [Gammaproteobacteria bacterium]NNM01660.1 rhodanese-like domain-containing protein [Gammaproteobacteria bacterium]